MKLQTIRHWRIVSMTAVLLCLFMGAAWRLGTGSLSAVGWESLYLICPLGYLETAAASKSLVLGAAIPFMIILVLTILVGRVFCGWVCPVPLTRKLLINELDDKPEPKTRPDAKGPLAVLGLTIGSAAVFGFPVFCLICPIGLTMGVLLAFIRLVGSNEPSWDLLLFPAVLVIELVLLHRWCSKICPVGALLSLFSRWQLFLVPKVNRKQCIEGRGGTCGQCTAACPAAIDLRHKPDKGILSECTKCQECSARCPVQAIKFTRR